MKKTRAVIFNLIFQLTLAILILDFQTNPQYLRSECITAHAQSETLGTGQIIDCISCQIFNSKQISDPFIGYMSIMVPLSDFPSGLNARLPFDSAGVQKDNLQDYFSYVATVYTQKGCSSYECPSFHILDDFSYASKDHRDQLNFHNIERNDVTFHNANLSIASLKRQIGITQEPAANILQTSLINKNDVSSLILRVRYSVNQRLERDRKPQILLYKLQTGIFVRFMLILVVLLESSHLYAILSHYTTAIKNILFLILLSGFIRPQTAILASALAIYLTIYRLYNAGNYGILVSSLFVLCSFLHVSLRVPFNVPTAFVIIYSIFITVKQLKERFGFLQLGTLVGFTITAISMWSYGWNFYIYITPLLILSGLLSIREKKEGQKHQSTKYDLVTFTDEEEDVLSKIQRQLR